MPNQAPTFPGFFPDPPLTDVEADVMRQLPSIKLGDHVLFDGFGAGTYYDALAVELGHLGQ